MIPYADLGRIISIHARVIVKNGEDVLFDGVYARTPEHIYYNAKVFLIKYNSSAKGYFIGVEI